MRIESVIRDAMGGLDRICGEGRLAKFRHTQIGTRPKGIGEEGTGEGRCAEGAAPRPRVLISGRDVAVDMPHRDYPYFAGAFVGHSKEVCFG